MNKREAVFEIRDGCRKRREVEFPGVLAANVQGVYGKTVDVFTITAECT